MLRQRAPWRPGLAGVAVVTRAQRQSLCNSDPVHLPVALHSVLFERQHSSGTWQCHLACLQTR